MRRVVLLFIFLLAFHNSGGQSPANLSSGHDITKRIREFIDTLKIIDTHEHLLNPDLVRKTNMFDFFLLMNHYYYNDLLSAGMPQDYFIQLYNSNLSSREKWKIIEPYWNKSSNTSFARIVKTGAQRLYNISEINSTTVDLLTRRIQSAYNSGGWFKQILRDSCRIEYLIQDGDDLGIKEDWIRYVKRFSCWLNVRSKYSIDSLAVEQVEPIFTLEDYVKSLQTEFNKGLKEKMIAVKINTAYSRPISFEQTDVSVARKVFRTLITADEDFELTWDKAKPLQDYMMFQLLDMAKKNKLPVIFHTGLLAGPGNDIRYSDPLLLTNIFRAYPEINFILFHGSYPYGGGLSTLAKNYSNVYIDMNWVYAISPTYAERYLNEWLETVPVSKIMAFGGDYNCVENIYAEYLVARQVIARVLAGKVSDGFMTEPEARNAARMILHDNAAAIYRLPQQ